MATKTSQEVAGMTQGGGGVFNDPSIPGKVWYPTSTGAGTKDYKTTYSDVAPGSVGSLSTVTAADNLGQQQQKFQEASANIAKPVLKVGVTPVKETPAPVVENKPDAVFIDTATGAEYTNPTPDLVKAKNLDFASGTAPDWFEQNDTIREAQRQIEEANKANEELNKQVVDFTTELDNFKKENDELYNQQIENIKAQFLAREKQMQNINERRAKTLQTGGFRTGAMRYGSETFEGIITEEERQGVSRLAEIDAQEAEALNAAKSAWQTQNWNIFDKKMTMVTKMQEQRQKEIETLNKKITDENDRMAKAKETQDKRDTEMSKNLAGTIVANLTGNETAQDFNELAQMYDIPVDKILGAVDEYKLEQKKALPAKISELQSAIEYGLVPEGTTLEQYQYITDPGLASQIEYQKSQTAKNYADMAKTKEEAAIASGEKVDPKAQAARSSIINQLNQVLSDKEGVKRVVGAGGFLPGFVVTARGDADILNKIETIKASLSIGARELIKGTGQISDFEAKTLERSTNTFGRNLTDDQAIQSLVDIRGALTTANGGSAPVKITGGGKSSYENVTSADIQQLVDNGYMVEYVESIPVKKPEQAQETVTNTSTPMYK
jgi:hypothetical protein